MWHAKVVLCGICFILVCIRAVFTVAVGDGGSLQPDQKLVPIMFDVIILILIRFQYLYI